MHTRNLTWSVLGFLYLFQRALSDSFMVWTLSGILRSARTQSWGLFGLFSWENISPWQGQMGILFSYNQLNYIRPHPECIQHWNNWTHTHTIILVVICVSQLQAYYPELHQRHLGLLWIAHTWAEKHAHWPKKSRITLAHTVHRNCRWLCAGLEQAR